jgi:hypothetical protein
VKSVLTNGKILLRFATASLIESLRRKPELYNNFVLYSIWDDNNSTTCYGSNYHSLVLPGQEQQQQSGFVNDDSNSALL